LVSVALYTFAGLSTVQGTGETSETDIEGEREKERERKRVRIVMGWRVASSARVPVF